MSGAGTGAESFRSLSKGEGARMDLTELELLEVIGRLPHRGSDDVIVGVGDDAAVVRIGGRPHRDRHDRGESGGDDLRRRGARPERMESLLLMMPRSGRAQDGGQGLKRRWTTGGAGYGSPCPL